MIAGLTQGACSMLGAWGLFLINKKIKNNFFKKKGPALDPKGKTGVLQLRALDWDMDGPFRFF